MPADTLREAVAQPYRPSNGTEGEFFLSEWCARCRRDAEFRAGEGDSCPIAAATMAFDVDDPEYPAEWIEDDAGPRCTAFQADSDEEPIGDARQTELLGLRALATATTQERGR